MIAVTYGRLLMDVAARTAGKFNVGTTAVTMMPSVLFLAYAWRLAVALVDSAAAATAAAAEADTPASPHHRRRRHRRHRRHRRPRWWTFLMTKTLTFILVWSSGYCWSNGLLPYLDAYTLSFLTMINDRLEPDCKLSQNTVLAMEPMLKLFVCYSAVVFVRWIYVYVSGDRSHAEHTRRRRARLRRMYEWHTQTREADELGQEGYLLMRSYVPETDPATGPPRAPRKTQSCVIVYDGDAAGEERATVQRRRSI